MKSGVIMKKAVLFAASVILIMIFPTNAFALDTRYIDTSLGIWGECDKDTVLLTDLDDYSGMLQYFYEDNCFYAHISYKENHMLYEDNDVLLDAKLHNDYGNNSFTFNKNGFIHSQKNYKLYQSFGEDCEYGQEIYFIIELLNSEDKHTINYLDLGITVNGYRYQLCSNLEFGTKPETTEKTEKTTKNGSAKAAGSGTTQKETKNTSTAQKTTKYKYSPTAAANSQSSKYYSDEADYINEADEEYDENQSSIITESEAYEGSSLSLQSKLLIGLACVFTAAACIFFVKAFLNSRTEKGFNAKADDHSNNEISDTSDNTEKFDDLAE